MTDNSHYCVFMGHIATCNDDMNVPLNSRHVAKVENSDNHDLHKMLHRANTQPDLLEALEAARDELDSITFVAIGEHYDNPILNATIAKAKGEQ